MAAKHQQDVPDFQRQVYCLLGLIFDAATVESAAVFLRATAATGRRCLMATPNLNFVALSRQDRAFRDSLTKSGLSPADGMPLIWCARVMGVPLRQRVSGSSLFESLSQHPSDSSMTVFLFGADEGVAGLADRNLNASAGNVRSVGFIEPGFGDLDELSAPWMIEQINQSNADFLVVCLGARKGHLWIDRNIGQLDAPIVSHLGAVIKFTAGVVRRAPGWMQAFGLEWLWRIKEEPPLWARYLKDGLAVAGLVATRLLPCALHERLNRPDGYRLRQAQTCLSDTGRFLVLRIEGAWSTDNVERLRAVLTQAAELNRPIELDLSATTWLDSAVIGLLLLLRGHCLGRGLPMRAPDASPAAKRLLKYHCAEYLLESIGSRNVREHAAVTDQDMAPNFGAD